MLFNSFEFILIFLPLCLVAARLCQRWVGVRALLGVLLCGSLIFYGTWNPRYLLLLLTSILVNFLCGRAMRTASPSHSTRYVLLVFGIIFNLFLIGYFKYAEFLTININYAFALSLPVHHVLLPIAISFFTFQQIAYLVDVFRGETEESSLLEYALFIAFFPQLIAGPIVHHSELVPQFKRLNASFLGGGQLSVGLTIFALGLFKKVVIADSIAAFATPVFEAADSGQTINFFEAWIGVLAYTFQLYFDFSGYSDMAIGLGRMFGIELPVNFLSPYKATSMIEFWRRWHVTLSRFLRDYLYIPLGGNRRGPALRFVNLIIVMLLGGLWHGAGWGFVLWGLLHGLYLVANHAWRHLRQQAGLEIGAFGRLGAIAGWCATFTAVIFAWVFFRATTLPGGLELVRAMLGMNGLSLPDNLLNYVPPAVAEALAIGFDFHEYSIFSLTLWGWAAVYIAICLAIVLAMPTTLEFVDYRNDDQRRATMSSAWDSWSVRWQPRPAYACLVGFLAFASVVHLWTGRPSEFLYFQF